MPRTLPHDPLDTAAFILRVNTEDIPVNARVLRVLWEGVREMYRRDLLVAELRTRRVLFHRPTLSVVRNRMKSFQDWIDHAQYPEGVRVARPTPLERIELTDWILPKSGLIATLDEAVELLDDVVVECCEGMMRLERRDVFVHNAIADRLYMEMADLISLSEVLINEGYHAENNLFKNFFGRFFTRKGPGTTK